MASQAPWYTYPRIDNFGQIDPQGNFYKPDSNIQLPGYYPVTALLPGVVTAAYYGNWGGQYSITIRLDKPINNMATHTVYQHLSGPAPGLTVGQHVNAGDLIAYNNPPNTVPLGFGFYSGDTYPNGQRGHSYKMIFAQGAQTY